MKKLAIAVLLSAMSSPLFAADLQCQVGSQVESGHCDTVIWGQMYAPASFAIVNVTKPISKVVWQRPTSCKNSTFCTFQLRAMIPYTGEALVLYTDGTYETLTGTVRFEDGR